jgi:two-component system phosphate regulon sensor histidine kinase PhoR
MARAEAAPLLVGAFAILILLGLAAAGSLAAWLAMAASLAVGGLAGVTARRARLARGMRVAVESAEAPVETEAWEGVLAAVQDPALLLDSEDAVLARNRRAAEISERLRTGMHVSSVIRDPDFLEALARLRASGEVQVVRYGVRVPVARNFQAVLVPLPASATRPGRPAVAVTFRDLTEQERLSRMRADFVANASHELRTPLAAVLGFVETLQGPARNDEAARTRFLAIIASEAARMQRLIGDLSSLAKIEMHEHVRPGGRVELCSLLSRVAETFAPLAKDAGIAIALAPCVEPALVAGDEDELTQVFHNLVGNALKYGRPGGHVDINLEREPPAAGKATRIAISVADDGIGIAEIHLHRLTERFYRVDSAASRAKGGTGLGLAIVKHILNRHEGELRIRSVLGSGSTLTVVLPELSP